MLVLSDERAREGHEGVAYDKADDDHRIGVHALRAYHTGVVARGAYGAAELRAEKPVKRADDGKNAYDAEQEHGVFLRKADCLERRIHAFDLQKRYVRLAHDAYVDRIQSDHREDARKKPRYFELGMQKPRGRARGHAAKHGDTGREVGVCAVRDHTRGDGGARNEAAVHRKVREVEHAVGDEHAYGHQRPQQPQGYRAVKDWKHGKFS